MRDAWRSKFISASLHVFNRSFNQNVSLALEQYDFLKPNVPPPSPSFFNVSSKMSSRPSPYDIIGVISFVQGCLTLVAAVFGAVWTVRTVIQKVLSRSLFLRQLLCNLQVRLNKKLMETLLSKITELRQHDAGSLVESGTRQHLLDEYAAFLYFSTLETETFLPD